VGAAQHSSLRGKFLVGKRASICEWAWVGVGKMGCNFGTDFFLKIEKNSFENVEKWNKKF
jgi:hypothetical protein